MGYLYEACDNAIQLFTQNIFFANFNENIYYHLTPWSQSSGSWIYNYLFNQYILPLKLWVRMPHNKVCQRLATGRWFSPGTSVFFTNKTDRHDITEILLKVALSTKNPKIGWRSTTVHMRVTVCYEYDKYGYDLYQPIGLLVACKAV